jgi:hypothetical protein
MDCITCEEKLSEYLEKTLPEAERQEIGRHLNDCPSCSSLLDEVKSLLAVAQNFPEEELDDRLLERILLRTSGQPRTKSFWEEFRHFPLRALWTPRFASGIALATLFVVLMTNLVFPRVSTVAAVLSPREVFRQLDIGVQKIYGKGLQAYDMATGWQADFSYRKNQLLNRLGFMMERLDPAVEGKAKPEERMQQQKDPKNKSSLLWKRV